VESFTTKALYTFVSETATPSHVHNIRLSAQADNFISETVAAKSSWKIAVLLFTPKYEPTLLARSIGARYEGKLVVGEVRGDNAALSKEFGVSRSPSLVVVCHGKDKLQSEFYSGDIKDYKSINSFLKAFESSSKCKQLQKKRDLERGEERRRLQKVRSLSEVELRKMRVSELRTAAEGLGLSTVGLLEKEDFVAAILQSRKTDKRVPVREESL